MDRFIIIGTAGHVDHGKTQLVRALTGIDTDRLKEEKERGISIELGFAPLRLPGGITAGIVDVPGHERFVKNMLAGAGGIDLVLFVVAADEGVMPQTQEHMDILELLHIQKAIIAITKTDLVDEEWLMLVEEDVKDLIASTRFSDSPIIPVSVVTRQGLEKLREVIEKTAKEVVQKPRSGDARLPIDRVFTITGFGTVVTGTLFSGNLHLGDTVEIQPTGIKARVRSLQVHGQKKEEALAGQRVAVNLTGVDVDQVARGDVLVTPGSFSAVRRVTGSLYLLPRAPHPLKNWQRVRFHLGTKEALGRVRLLDRDEISPGSSALVQLELEEPVVAAVHDRFVIRYYSPVTTIGGGEIIEVGVKRYRRFREEVIDGLERKLTGTPEMKIEEELRSVGGPAALNELIDRTAISEDEIIRAIEDLEQAGRVEVFLVGSDQFIVASHLEKEWLEQVKKTLADYHRKYPLRSGYPKEEMRSRFLKSLTPRLYQAVLDNWVEEGEISIDGQSLALPDFSIKLTPQQEESIAQLCEKMQTQLFSPPGVEEIQEMLGNDQDLLQYCLQQGLLVKVSEDLFFLREGLEKAWLLLEKHLSEQGDLTIAQARDILGTSRRFCLPLLEYFDRMKKTKRVGDKRVLLSRSTKNPSS